MKQFVSGEVDVLVLHAHRGEWPRRAQRQHDVREPGRPLRAGPALPAARPRGALAPARLLLPASSPTRSTRTPSAACRCSSTTPSSAPATASRSRTWSCAGRGTCSAPSSPGSCTRWASTSTCGCSTRPCASCSQRATARRPFVPADVSLDVPAYLPDDFIAAAGGEARHLSAPDGVSHRRGDRRPHGSRCATASVRSRRPRRRSSP